MDEFFQSHDSLSLQRMIYSSLTNIFKLLKLLPMVKERQRMNMSLRLSQCDILMSYDIELISLKRYFLLMRRDLWRLAPIRSLKHNT